MNNEETGAITVLDLEEKYNFFNPNNSDFSLTKIRETIPPEKNIINEIPEIVLKKSFICSVMDYLLDCIQESAFSNITFTKLKCVDFDDDEAVIEWNYNYFRVYFYFDFLKEESEIGFIKNIGNNSFLSRTEIYRDDFKNAVKQAYLFVVNSYQNK